MKSKSCPIAIAMFLSGCSSAYQFEQTVNPQTEALAQAQMVLSDGHPNGTVKLVTADGQVFLVIEVSGISPGSHGFHLHTTGLCEGPAFTSAGGHLNPAGRQHGLDNPQGHHLGDLPNIQASAGGNVSSTVALSGSHSEILAALFDADGSAVMIHADTDDGVSDPAGNAGPRIACGALVMANP